MAVTAEWDPQVCDFCLPLFALVSSPRNHVRTLQCSRGSELAWTELHLISQTAALFQASDALYSGIISEFRWTEEPRCTWPLSAHNSIKAKSDLLHLPLHLASLTMSLNFTSVHGAPLAWMWWGVLSQHLPFLTIHYTCTISIYRVVRALWCTFIFISTSSV